MKSKLFRRVVVLGSIAFTLTGCSNAPTKEIKYPDYPTTPGDKDSWEYLKDANGNVESWDLTWYVNDPGFSWNTYGDDRVSQVIKQKTGANIKFVVNVQNDNQKLSTLIAGNKLPDIVTVQCWYDTCHTLARDGYLYPLDGLIERWAPSFVEKEQTDIWNYFKEADGYTYGVPNFAYSTKYVNDTDKMEPNGCLLVREDWFNEVTAEGIDMTTPTGFIAGCKRAKQLHPSAIPFQLDSFTSEGNESIDWLAQYFCSAYEKEDGTYQDIRLSPRYKEMLVFLNSCYKEGLISSETFSDKPTQINTKIGLGNVFVSAVTPQDYQTNFMSAYTNKNARYVPLVLRNKDGEAPILQDISGNGYLLTMISRNCKRPDKAIKLLEYLYSEEGQRLVCFGVEGESYNWNNDHTMLEWSDRYVSGVEGNLQDKAWINTLGLYQMTLLMNLAYVNKIKPLNGREQVDIYMDNLKRPLTPYSYNFKPTFLKHDTSKSNYTNISTWFNNCKTHWASYIANIIRASDPEAEYNSSINLLKRYKLDDVNAFYAESYQDTKQLLGVTYGYPKNNPNYVEPTTGPNGDFSYWRSATHE